MAKLTHINNGNDWEAIYIEGEKVTDQHLGRLWPKSVLDLMVAHDITETETKTEPEFEFPEVLEDE